MDILRPRPSVLSLFDPLASPDSDKENDNHGTSFFHPIDSQGEGIALVAHIPKCRLIDVGDMTTEVTDANLLLDEDALEQEFDNEELDENETLTFRDMAKAASPKSSTRIVAIVPPPPLTPRTPLAEISLKDDMTPMARPKFYKRQAPPTSKLCRTIQLPSSTLTPRAIHPSTEDNNKFISIITHSSTEETPKHQSIITSPDCSSENGGTMGHSTCSLNLPNPTRSLLAETAIPLLASPSSSCSSPDALTPPSLLITRPRSPRTGTTIVNRYSMDLQASFQLHLSSSEPTFDLLNDKISFFNSPNGLDSLNDLEEDGSFDSEDPALPPSRSMNDDVRTIIATSVVENEQQNPPSLIFQDQTPQDFVATQVQRSTSCTSATLDIKHGSERIPCPALSPSCETFGMVAKSSLPTTTSCDKRQISLATPNTSSDGYHFPPRPVPALRIVKRSNLINHFKTGPPNTVHAEKGSSNLPAAPQGLSHLSPPASTLTLPCKPPTEAHPPCRPPKTAITTSLLGDGPRRVLIGDGFRSNPITKSSASKESHKASNVPGPRRLVTTAMNAEKPSTDVKLATEPHPSKGLRQPVKNATIRAASAIPKPVSRRGSSRLPTPIGTTRRVGVPTISIPSNKNTVIRRVM